MKSNNISVCGFWTADSYTVTNAYQINELTYIISTYHISKPGTTTYHYSIALIFTLLAPNALK